MKTKKVIELPNVECSMKISYFDGKEKTCIPEFHIKLFTNEISRKEALERTKNEFIGLLDDLIKMEEMKNEVEK